MIPRTTTTASLNPNGPLPLYHQLAGDLHRQLEAGSWTVHEMLPSEAELGQHYGVSRTVVRQALDELERSGALYRVKGKGSFIAERKLSAYLMQDVAGFAANMAAQGLEVQSQVLRQDFVAAPAAIAQALGLPENARVLRLERLRFVQGEPLFLGTTFIPEALGKRIASADFSSRSLNAALAQDAGVEPASGMRLIEAVAAGRLEADLLRVRVGAPLFRLFAVTYDEQGAGLECSEVWLRADRLAFRVALGHPPTLQAHEDQLHD